MLGHPWWANESANLALFTRAQTLFNTQKLHYLIEEAWLPENSHRLFIGCLTHISAGELISIFASLSQQLSDEPYIPSGQTAFLLHAPWPPNLLLIGTMDTDHYDWWDSDLVSKTSVFLWQAGERAMDACAVTGKSLPSLEEVFLQSNIRQEGLAYQKLREILGRNRLNSKSNPVALLLRLVEQLEINACPTARQSLREAIIYLANAWSPQGVGLFDLDDKKNLALAVDRALVSTVFPLAYQTLQKSQKLREILISLLNPHYPISAWHLKKFR
jgi:hypothetical protein